VLPGLVSRLLDNEQMTYAEIAAAVQHVPDQVQQPVQDGAAHRLTWTSEQPQPSGLLSARGWVGRRALYASAVRLCCRVDAYLTVICLLALAGAPMPLVAFRVKV
jgi:hypothetical protein